MFPHVFRSFAEAFQTVVRLNHSYSVTLFGFSFLCFFPLLHVVYKGLVSLPQKILQHNLFFQSQCVHYYVTQQLDAHVVICLTGSQQTHLYYSHTKHRYTPRGCVLSPVLYTIFTYDFTPSAPQTPKSSLQMITHNFNEDGKGLQAGSGPSD